MYRVSVSKRSAKGHRTFIVTHHDDVRQFSFFDRTKIAIETQVLGSIDGATLQGLHRCHAALHKTPHFPMRANPGQLAMPAGLHQPAVGNHLLSDLGDLHVVVIFVRCLFAATRSWVEYLRRNERLQTGVQPKVVDLVPVTFAVL